jgi:UDP-2-acetamido-3-amino-2,3-dideoxy-glucuronate N-acetyltransferase
VIEMRLPTRSESVHFATKGIHFARRSTTESETVTTASQSDEPITATIHSSAEIEPGVEIGPGTRVWRRAHIRSGARIGRDCNIGANVFVDAHVSIGDRCKIQNNVSVYEGVTLADEAFVGPAAVFTNDRNPRATGDWLLTETNVGRGASVGANATIVCGNDLGEHCLVAAGAVVTRSVLPHQLVVGNPARPAGWVCRCGEVVSRAAERPSDLSCDHCDHLPQ